MRYFNDGIVAREQVRAIKSGCKKVSRTLTEIDELGCHLNESNRESAHHQDNGPVIGRSLDNH